MPEGLAHEEERPRDERFSASRPRAGYGIGEGLELGLGQSAAARLLEEAFHFLDHEASFGFHRDEGDGCQNRQQRPEDSRDILRSDRAENQMGFFIATFLLPGAAENLGGGGIVRPVEKE